MNALAADADPSRRPFTYGSAAARSDPPAPAASPAPDQLSMRTKVFAFTAMCVGFFIALLDIQIVSASLRDIGGGLSAGADETAWVQTSYLIAEMNGTWLSPSDGRMCL